MPHSHTYKSTALRLWRSVEILLQGMPRVFIILTLATLLLVPVSTHAVDTATDITSRANRLFGGGTTSPGDNPLAERIGVIINTSLLLVGMIFLMIVVYSGIMWMTAGGNEEKVEQAQARIKRATIGLIVIVGAWIIVNTVLRAVFNGGPSSTTTTAQLRITP